MNNEIYLFELTINQSNVIYLTNSTMIQYIGNKEYMPNSGINILTIVKGQAHDILIINGIFEENAISDSSILVESCLKIFSLDAGIKKSFMELEYLEVKHDNIAFEATFASQSMNLLSSIIKTYSRTCRANLGDNDCKLDFQDFAEKVRVISIDKNKIIIYKSKRPGSYYNEGKILFRGVFFSNIISSNHQELIIEDIAKFPIGTEIILYPRCDKTLSTCANMFNNAINFRGEPFTGMFYEER